MGAQQKLINSTRDQAGLETRRAAENRPNVTVPDVTVVVSLRERFSVARRSLDSLYADVSTPFDLIYVESSSPRSLKRYLSEQSRRRGFRLIEAPPYVTPNEARNLAIPQVATEFIAFVDNDCLFAPGWLAALLRCAKETGADIVTPIICYNDPEFSIIHFAGGDAGFFLENGKRIFRERHRSIDRLLAEARPTLARGPSELAEFHCMLVRKDVFDRFGLLDEELRSIGEHTDICLKVREGGGIVMFEPDSVMSYVSAPRIRLNELPYFLFRWSEELARDSENHFLRKWNAAMDNGRTILEFVRDHRRHALAGSRNAIQRLMGWRISTFLFEGLANACRRYGKWRRSRAAGTERRITQTSRREAVGAAIGRTTE